MTQAWRGISRRPPKPPLDTMPHVSHRWRRQQGPKTLGRVKADGRMLRGLSSLSREDSADRARRVGDPQSIRRATTHLWQPTLLGKPPTARRRARGVGSGQRGRRALRSPLCGYGPRTTASNRLQPPAILQLTQNLKANPPGSLPVLGAVSATRVHADPRPGSEDAE